MLNVVFKNKDQRITGSYRSRPFLTAVSHITGRLRTIIYVLACRFDVISARLVDDIPINIIPICKIISNLLDSSSDLDNDEINLIGTAIDALDDQVNLLEDQPELAHEALIAFKELLFRVIDLIRERREARDLAAPSSKDPEWVDAVWESLNKTVDEHASESEDPTGLNDLYDDSINQSIMEGQERCMISKRSDPGGL